MNNKTRVLIAVTLIITGAAIGGYYLISTGIFFPPKIHNVKSGQVLLSVEKMSPIVDKTNEIISNIVSVATPIVSLLSLIGGLILLYLNIIKAWRDTFKGKVKAKKHIKHTAHSD